MLCLSPYSHADLPGFYYTPMWLLWLEWSPFPHCAMAIPSSILSLFSLSGPPTSLSSTSLKSVTLHGSALLYHLPPSSLLLLNAFHSYIFSTWWYIPLCCLIFIHPTNNSWGSIICQELFRHWGYSSGYSSEYSCLSWSLRYSWGSCFKCPHLDFKLLYNSNCAFIFSVYEGAM